MENDSSEAQPLSVITNNTDENQREKFKIDRKQTLSDIAHPRVVGSYLRLERVYGNIVLGHCTKCRVASYLHQIMLFLLMKSEPVICLKNDKDEEFVQLMNDYAIQRVIDIDEKYCKMLVPHYEHGMTHERYPIVYERNMTLLTSPKFGKVTTIHEYFTSLIDHYFDGELARYAKLELQKLRSYDSYVDNLKKFLNQHFTSHEFAKNGEFDAKFCSSLLLLIEFLAGEILTQAENLAVHISWDAPRRNIITLNHVVGGLEHDHELRNFMHLKAIGYFSTAFEPFMDDFTCYDEDSGAALSLNHESITTEQQLEYKNDEKELHLVEKPSLKKRKFEKELTLFSQLPPELHEEIVKHFSPLGTLLDKRLVSKRWNNYISRNKEIWKYLCFHTLQEEHLLAPNFRNLTTHELWLWLSSPKFYSSPFGHIVKLSGHDNNFHEIYNLKVRYHIQRYQELTSHHILRDKRGFNFCDQVIPFIQKHGAFGATSCKFGKPMNYTLGETQLFGTPYLPPNFKVPKSYRFFGQINCEHLRGLVSLNRYMPLKGMIYFFIDKACCHSKVIHVEEAKDLRPLETKSNGNDFCVGRMCDSLFILNDYTFQRSLDKVLEHCVDDGTSPVHGIKNTFSIVRQVCIGVTILNNNSKPSRNDVILLRARNVNSKVLSFMISEEDLRLRNFGHCWLKEEVD